jgi:hypothetical protein
MEIIKNITALLPGDHKTENYRGMMTDLVESQKLWGVICL